MVLSPLSPSWPKHTLGSPKLIAPGLQPKLLLATSWPSSFSSRLHPGPAAWRLYSRRLDRDLWVARDAEAATGLDADGARAGLPLVLADDLERLRNFDDQRLRRLLDVLAMFPGARLAEFDSEAGVA